MFGYTVSNFSSPVSGVSAGGQLSTNSLYWVSGTADVDVWAMANSASTTLQVPNGSTYYFEIRGTVAGTATGASVSTQIAGDAAFPAAFQSGFDVGEMASSFNGVHLDTNNDFIWTPNSTTSVTTITQNDFTNGYGVLGLPAGGINNQVLSR